MNIDDKELLPGESILLTKKANAVIRINRSFRRGQEIAPSRTESVNARRPVMVNQNRDLLESNRHLEQEPSLLSYPIYVMTSSPMYVHHRQAFRKIEPGGEFRLDDELARLIYHSIIRISSFRGKRGVRGRYALGHAPLPRVRLHTTCPVPRRCAHPRRCVAHAGA